jgi:predicted RNase H-like HicB family nuclease
LQAGAYLVEYPDLCGCMSDGDTIEEAIASGEDAKRCWTAAMKEAGRPIPLPSLEPAEDVQRQAAAPHAKIAASPRR